MMATKAQLVALRWLIEHDLTAGIHSSALHAMYEDRALAEHEANQRTYGHRPTAMRVVSWKRTSGRVLRRMRIDGLADYDGWDAYTPRYKITEAGMEAARDG